VLSRLAASSLNVRVLVAHVGVSMLGKMLKMTRLPFMLALLISCKVPVVSANFGSVEPLAGSDPLIATGLPPSVTVVAFFLAVDFFAAFFTDFFAVFFFEDFFADFFAVFFLTDFFVAFLATFFDFFLAAMGVSLIENGLMSLPN
jgi:hypothetical protein